MVATATPAPARPRSRAAMSLKIVLAAAMLLVMVFGVGHRLVGSWYGLNVTHGVVQWPHEPVMSVVVEPTRSLIDAHRTDTNAAENLFPWRDSSNGTVDAATGKPPVEYVPLTGRISFWGPASIDRLYFAGPGLLGDLIVLAILILLWRLVGTLDTEVFSRANVRRMVAIGLLVGIGLSGAALLAIAGQAGLVQRSAAAGQVTVPFHFSFVPLLAGAVIVVFAEVFRRGIDMREDLETVV